VKILTTNNEWIDANVGQAFCGIGFKEVVLTPEDVYAERFEEWFSETIIPRFITPWESPF
jgi:hypothetical protein